MDHDGTAQCVARGGDVVAGAVPVQVLTLAGGGLQPAVVPMCGSDGLWGTPDHLLRLGPHTGRCSGGAACVQRPPMNRVAVRIVRRGAAFLVIGRRKYGRSASSTSPVGAGESLTRRRVTDRVRSMAAKDPTDIKRRRRMPRRAQTPENASKAGRTRWSPEARTREAVRVLVAQLAPLTEEQKDELRLVLARPARQNEAQ